MEENKCATCGKTECPGCGDDEMLMDGCAKECMEAIHGRDSKKFRDSFKVLVAHTMMSMGMKDK